MRTTRKPVILCFCLSVLSSGCSHIPKLNIFPGVYKIDIQQGNKITQKMINQLRPGMTKRQVQFVMGTPLIKDPFNQNRWDYVYSIQPGGKPRQQESVVLYFENGRLSYLEGDYRPQELP